MKTGNCILVLGKTGQGKTTSLRNLDPKETIIIMPIFKTLPFPNWKKNYIVNGTGKANANQGLIFIAQTLEELQQTLKIVSSENYAKRFKNIIIDDFQLFSQSSIFENMQVKGYEKWVELANLQYKALMGDKENSELGVIQIPSINGQNMIIFWHSNTDTETENRGSRVKTGSKALDSYLTVESLFTYALEAFKTDKGYIFKTNSEGQNDFVKSPLGVFELFEPNDMKKILSKIDKFENGE